MAAAGFPVTRASPGTTRRSALSRQAMDLPHKSSGELDYHTLGNMITASIMEEVLYASYADYEHGNQVCGFRPDTDWQFYYKEKDVIVLKKRIANSKICCFMGRGVIDAPLQQVAAYIHHFRNRFSWDQYLVQHEICHQLSENDWLLYMAHVATRCLFKSRRDFFYYCRTGYLDDKYVQTDISVEDPDYPPRPPYIRAEILKGTGWLLEKYDGSECSTLVSYLAHLDLKQLPPVIVNRVLRREPMAIHYIRRSIITPITTQPSLIPSLDPDNPDFSASLNMDIPYEDSNPVNFFTNRFSERGRNFSQRINLRPKSSTFSVLSSSNTGYSIQPLHDDTPTQKKEPQKCTEEEVAKEVSPELKPFQDTLPETILETKSDQPAIDSQQSSRSRAFSTSLPGFDFSNHSDLPDGLGVESPPPGKSSLSHFQSPQQHLPGLLHAGLLAKSHSSRIESSPWLSSSL